MLMLYRKVAVATIASLVGLGVTAAPAVDDRAVDAPPELRPTAIGTSGELRGQLALSGKMKVESCYEVASSEGETIQQCDMTFDGPDGIEIDVRMTSESSNWEQHLFDQFQSCQEGQEGQEGEEEERVPEGDATLNANFRDDGTGGFSHSTSPTKCVEP